MKHRTFDYPTEQEFIADLSQIAPGLPYCRDASILKTPLNHGKLVIKNRILIQPIEGFDAETNGSPSPRSFRRYQELADHGAGTLWVESISVTQAGRSNPKQLWIHSNNVGSFREFTDKLHACAKGASPVYLVAQLTHSGRYCKPGGNPSPVCAYDNPLIPKENARIIRDDEIAVLEEDYLQAALLAEEAGFDAVDIRACHGYLINELFSAYHRPGKYGGSFENRTAMLFNIVDKVQALSHIAVGVRLNVYDGLPYPYGWGCDFQDVSRQDMSEPLKAAKILSEKGVALLNVSAGIGAYSPHVLRPYDKGGNIPDEHPLEGVARLLNSAKSIKAACPGSVVVSSGLSWLRQYAPMVAAGCIQDGWFDLAGFGRQAIAYPAFVRDLLSLRKIREVCSTCSGCTTLIKKSGNQVRCIMRKDAY